jgi:hypothetical protein
MKEKSISVKLVTLIKYQKHLLRCWKNAKFKVLVSFNVNILLRGIYIY